MLGGFREQLARVERFLDRVRDQDRDSREYDDDLWSFFQHCYHLKDWIKADPQVPQCIRDSVEQDLDQCTSLRICADLANRTKHRVLTKRIRVGASPKSRNVSVRLKGALKLHARIAGSEHETKPQHVETESAVSHIIELNDGSEHVAQDVAEQAVRDWKALLNKFKLI